MFRFGRVVRIALEDFGLRRPERTDAPIVAFEVLTPPAAASGDLPEGVVWRGSAQRRPELQRFCDHLTLLREGVS